MPLPAGLVQIDRATSTEGWVDGEHLGVTPFAATHVPIGTSTFRLRFPHASEATAPVDGTVGDTGTLMIDRARAPYRTGYGSADSFPAWKWRLIRARLTRCSPAPSSTMVELSAPYPPSAAARMVGKYPACPLAYPTNNV